MFNRKKMFYLLFTLLLLLGFNSNVYAADKEWPELNKDSVPNEYKSMDYCVYFAPVKVRGRDNVYSKLYNNKRYIFIHNDNAKEILFLDDDKQIVRLINLKDNSYTWDKKGSNQKIWFYGDFYNYLVDGDGNLNCNKLAFIASNEDSGDLAIYVKDKHFASYYLYGMPSYDTEAEGWEDKPELKQHVAVSGSLIGENVINQCRDYHYKVKQIATTFYDNNGSILTETIDGFRKLNASTYKEGDIDPLSDNLVRISQYLETTRSDLEKLNLSTKDNGYGFNINKCSKYNTLVDDYNSLISSMNTIESQIKWANNRGDTILKLANASADEVAKFEEAKANINETIEKWNSYIDNVKFGYELGDNVTCEGMLGPDLIDDISLVLTWIRVSVPIILIVLGSIDFGKAVLSDEPNELKKATSRFVKRCIIACIIFFIPSIIMFLISLVDKLKDVSCDIRLW